MTDQEVVDNFTLSDNSGKCPMLGYDLRDTNGQTIAGSMNDYLMIG